MSPRAREFIQRNTANKVVSGTWLDRKGCNIKTWGDAWRIQFRFDSGRTLSLRQSDLAAVTDAGHVIRWHGVEAERTLAGQPS